MKNRKKSANGEAAGDDNLHFEKLIFGTLCHFHVCVDKIIAVTIQTKNKKHLKEKDYCLQYAYLINICLDFRGRFLEFMII